jgi:hypothetical protein
VTVYYHANKFFTRARTYFCVIYISPSAAYKSRRLAHSLFSLACNIKRKLNNKKCKKVSSAPSRAALVRCCCFCVSTLLFFLKSLYFLRRGWKYSLGRLWNVVFFCSRSPTIALRETRNITRARSKHQNSSLKHKKMTRGTHARCWSRETTAHTHTHTHVGPSKVFAPQITTHEHHHHNKIKLCAAGDISEPNRLGSGIMWLTLICAEKTGRRCVLWDFTTESGCAIFRHPLFCCGVCKIYIDLHPTASLFW